MMVDRFLIDAPRAVPEEFKAWEIAKERQQSVYLGFQAGSAERDVAKAEADRLERVARAAWLQTLRHYVEIHVNADARETRHCFIDDEPFRFHRGFTREDYAAGWRQVMATASGPNPDDDTFARIEQAKSDELKRLNSYWTDLAEAPVRRVIIRGYHSVAHDLGEGVGFGGAAFRVKWMAPDREPTVCNLSAQGRIPSWMREKLPDNALAIEELLSW